ncbi:MAG: ABC transporter substrate-binding protein [Anaerolineae bacterium]|nr:ABC transporter substrate-binding protein [Anaerolineae bacterium]
MLKKSLTIMAIMALLVAVLAACAGEPTVVTTVETQIVTEVQTRVVEVGGETVVEEVVVTRVVEIASTPEVIVVEATPEPVTRTGAWVDTVVVIEEASADAAVNRLAVGDIDIYAFQVTNPAVRDNVLASSELALERSFGSYSELSFNPVGPEFPDGNLNPFAVPAVREAMNWLVDRQYIAEEIHGGMAVPRWLPFNGASNDYASIADIARALELKYGYNKELAQEVISAEMEALGATLGSDGKWQYNGAPVVITLLIRTEDERRDIGDYLGNQLEDIGFTVVRDYKTAAEASPIWINGDPAAGLFHIYTGGWITTAVPRDLGGNFAFFYTDQGLASPLWQAYENDPEFYDLATRLDNNDFTTLEERRELIARAAELAMQDSMRIWLIDRASITPRRADISVAADLYGSVAGSTLWPYTLRQVGEIGGSVTIAMPSILTNPWNPLGGSNWIYDAMLYRGTGEFAVNPDPFTGLNWPNRIERAEVVVKEGLPVGKTLDWVSLEFASEIAVPGDAWVDWDATEQRFITAAEAYTQTVTVNSKNIVYYPADLYDTVKWHDGSAFSAADVVMAIILQFDRAKEDSPNFDSGVVAGFNAFMSAFRGVRILSVDPLILETYTNNYQLDAEQNINAWWPQYGFGSGAWHNLALGLRADAEGLAAFTSGKANTNEVEQISYISGPTLTILKEQLDASAAESYIPYAATLGEYISDSEVAERYSNLAEWYRRRGHFWLGTGVFYLERAFPVEGTVILQRNTAYPDLATRWDRFSAPAISEVDLDGEGRVTIGGTATYEVYVTYQGEDYAVDDIAEVKYLIIDANGELAHVGTADAVSDGLWEINLDAEITGKLVAGSNRLEVIVVSKRVALPSNASLQFVTAP